jgi:small-conductance mechanosensitive channel
MEKQSEGILMWTSVRDALQPIARSATEIIPDLLGALALLVGGALLARFLRVWGARLIDRLPWLGRGRTVEGALRRMGIERTVGELVGGVLFWVVFVIFLTAATETLGLPVLATWLRGVSDYLPRVLLAVLIVVVGLLGGALARDAIGTAVSVVGMEQRAILGRAAQAVIVLVAVVTAIDQLGIDSRFFTAIVGLVAGAVIGGTALAFGLGARTTVSNIIACHYVRQTYRIGQVVRVGDMQGAIAEITTTAVILEAPGRRILVPAKEFSEKVSILVTEGG